MGEQVMKPARRLSREIVQLMLEMNSELRQRGVTVALTASDACEQLIQQSARFEDTELASLRRRLVATVTDVPETKPVVEAAQAGPALAAGDDVARENVEPFNVFVRDPEKAQFTCDQCQRNIKLDPVQLEADAPPLSVTCACGALMHVDADGRKYPRHSTRLSGRYTQPEQGKSGAIVVEDISFGGLRFVTSLPHQIAHGDRLDIQFTLDDEDKSIITEPIEVRYVNQNAIGAQFANAENFDKRLVKYLFR